MYSIQAVVAERDWQLDQWTCQLVRQGKCTITAVIVTGVVVVVAAALNSRRCINVPRWTEEGRLTFTTICIIELEVISRVGVDRSSELPRCEADNFLTAAVLVLRTSWLWWCKPHRWYRCPAAAATLETKTTTITIIIIMFQSLIPSWRQQSRHRLFSRREEYQLLVTRLVEASATTTIQAPLI